MWIGYTDKAQEGQWKLMNGRKLDASDQEKPMLYHWRHNEPNAKTDEDCALVENISSEGGNLSDVACKLHYHAVCEMKHNVC